MSRVLPYHIHHIQLNNDQLLNISPKVGLRYYYVFWWKNIPLGQLLIEEEGVTNIHTSILDAILPALKKYSIRAKYIKELQSSYLSYNYIEFNLLIEKILENFLNKEIPEKVDISIVICTRNRSESLKKCLEKINMQLCMPTEILVIDNAPSDKATKAVAKQFINVTYHKEPKPGLSIARNLGAKLAKCPIIAYTDDDVEVDKLWTYNIWNAFNNEEIDALTGLVIASSLETESQQIFEKHWGFNKGYEDIYFNLNYIQNSKGIPRVWEIGAGANMAFKKEVISKMNYFDERQGAGASGCSEDSELWLKMLINGYKIQYNPRAVVFHEHRKEKKQLKKQLYSYMRGHVVSILLQHKENKFLGYKRYAYQLPNYYLLLLRMGFPNFKFRYSTLLSEIKGLISGLKFYAYNKNKPRLVKK
ncbi:glycosyltransferase family 2 protein [Flavobacterium cellulosilyticum]|uniref:Glycosyltransferase n=1 Tax=Flavobacterium cellulosilyticum TaxID=2541731 RepID=A0A4R5CQA7_9FLAO|nr:glycosyltransferase [Flavobacterium cellulosilyticum]TDD99844.1 glycosyltransferase [Flavobacterium cellulosilyticum]